MQIRFTRMKEFPIFLVLVGISIIITITNPSFATLENFLDLLRGNLTLIIMALGMLLIILTGGIDVSVASIITAVNCIIGYFLINVSSNIFMAILLAILAGTALGLINGLLIARLKIPPIVATLGTMSIILGTVLYLTNGNWMTGIPDNFIKFGRTMLFPVTLESGRSIGLPIQIIFAFPAIFISFHLSKVG